MLINFGSALRKDMYTFCHIKAIGELKKMAAFDKHF